MENRIAERKRRLTRVNIYVIVVALLWLATSVALLVVSTPGSANAAEPSVPPPSPTVLHASLSAPHAPGSLQDISV